MDIKRRDFVLGGAGLLATSCTSFDHHTGEKKSCDWVNYDLNTGLNFGLSTQFSPVWLADGNSQYKWNFNDLINVGANNAQPIVTDPFSGGPPPLPNTKWIRSITNNQNGNHLYRYCFCISDPERNSPERFSINEMDILVSHEILAVKINAFQFTGYQPGVSSFTYDPNNNGHTYHKNALKLGINCLDIHVINTTPIPQPTAVSVAGNIGGLSCCVV